MRLGWVVMEIEVTKLGVIELLFPCCCTADSEKVSY